MEKTTRPHEFRIKQSETSKGILFFTSFYFIFINFLVGEGEEVFIILCYV